ncbi:MAG: hypothetical protein IJ192_11510 [Clostridia bacterium]|nr:hypothetical protein [Clostridia bacterium]
MERTRSSKVFEHDDRFMKAYNNCKDKEEVTMCEFVDKLEARGEARGREKERENSIKIAILAFKKLKSTAEAARDYIM